MGDSEERMDKLLVLFGELRKLPREERASRLARIAQEDRDLSDSLAQLLRDDEAGDSRLDLGALVVSRRNAVHDQAEAPARSHSERILVNAAFEEETRRFLQTRLRLAALAGTIALSIVVSVMLVSALTRGVLVLPRSAGSVAPLMALALVAALHYTLSRRPLASITLGVIDGILVLVLFASLLVHIALDHDFSCAWCLMGTAVLTHIVLTRGAFVPSTAARTFWLSAPAPLVLGLTHWGRSFSSPLGGGAHGEQLSFMIVSQALLWSAIGVACLSSHINLGLRRRTFEAKQLGQYELHECLGRGAMGEVYRATHTLMKRPTAIKFMHPNLAGSTALQRFEAEVVKTCRLSHPNIISIYDYGRTAEGAFYYAMELIDGEDLQTLVEREGPLDQVRVQVILAQACDALHHSHERGLIHRDVKAANMMLCDRGSAGEIVKLLDFGLVKDLADQDRKLTLDHQVLGTPETMAPEIILGEAPGPQSDVYSLSAVGYRLLTGRPLFEARTLGALLDAHLHDDPVPISRLNPQVSEELEAVLLRGVSKRPADRFTSTLDMKEALLAVGPPGASRTSG